MSTAVLAACTTADEKGADSQPAGESPSVDPKLGEDLLWNDGPCDESKPTVNLGQIAPFHAGTMSLEDQALAAEASARAFNKRGGMSGRCIKMVTCDEGGDPNKAADCARELVGEEVVATVNDTVISAADVVNGILQEAGIPRLDGTPAPAVFGQPNIYTLGMGGLGNVIMTLPPLAEAGSKKYAIIRADVPGTAAIKGLMGKEAAAYGGEIVADIPVTVGTSDYSQFVLAAQNAGADGVIMAVGRDEATQILRAAQQLDSDLLFSMSLGSVSRNDLAQFGDYADNFVFNGEMPPASTDPTRYPILAVAVRELAASDEANLQQDSLTNASLRSWVYMYALVKMARDAGLTDPTAASVTETLNAAKDVDMAGLTPPWTPNNTSDGPFLRVSQPSYWIGRWDGRTDNIVLAPEQLDSVKVLAGEV